MSCCDRTWFEGLENWGGRDACGEGSKVTDLGSVSGARFKVEIGLEEGAEEEEGNVVVSPPLS